MNTVSRAVSQTASPFADPAACRALLSAVGEAVILVDTAGYVQDCSDACLHERGYARSDLPGLHLSAWEAHFRPEELAARHRSLIDAPGCYDTVHRRKDGTTFPVRITARPLPIEGRKLLLLSARALPRPAASGADPVPELRETRLGWAAEQTGLTYWEYDRQRDTLTVDGAARILLGTTAAPAGGDGFSGASFVREFVPESDRPALSALLERALARPGEEQREELRIRRRDGTTRRIFVRAAADGEPGSPGVVRAAVQDVTELRRLESGVCDEQQQFRGFMAALPANAFIKDRDGRFHFMNAAMKAMLKVEDDNYVGRHQSEVFPPADTPALRASDEAVLRSMQPENHVVQLRFAGAERTMLVQKFPIRRPGGETLLGGVATDITDRHRAEQALRRSEERYRSVVSAMAEGVVQQAADGTIVDCNSQAEQILGLTRDQIMGRTSFDPRWGAVRPDGSPWPGEEHPGMVALRTGRGCRNVVMGIDVPDRARRWISISAEPVAGGTASAPTGVVATISDITERIHKEQAMQDLLAQADAAARTKGDLLREVNHRVTNNLAAVLGLIAFETRQIDPARGAVVGPVLGRLGHYLESMLHIHRLLAETLWAPLQIDQLADHIVKAALGASPWGRSAAVTIAPGPARVSPRQAGSLALVLNELATNTIKYAPRPGSAGRIEIRVAAAGTRTVLTFRDNGPGYPPETLAGQRLNVGLRLIREVVATTFRGSVRLANDDGAVTELTLRLEDPRRT